MANRNYVIIDHHGSMTEAQMKTVYAKAYAKAYAEGFQKNEIFTLKKFCSMINPAFVNLDEDGQNSVKNYVRFNKSPKLVIVVTNELTSRTQWFIDQWEERSQVELIEFNPLPAKQYDFGENNSRKRRCASIWADALGWTFSAPLYREHTDEVADCYFKRNDYTPEELASMNDVEKRHITKITTKSESYLEQKREIASDEEIEQFFVHYKFLQQAGLLAESLECDYELCPICGRPHHKTAESCPWCDQEFEAQEDIAYYDEDMHPGKHISNDFDIDVSHADLAEKRYVKYLTLENLVDKGYFYPETKSYYI